MLRDESWSTTGVASLAKDIVVTAKPDQRATSFDDNNGIRGVCITYQGAITIGPIGCVATLCHAKQAINQSPALIL